MRLRPAGHAVLVAALLTAADCAKPLHIDDPAYYFDAAHLARHPLDPYGLDIFWYEYPEPANAILAPPVTLYWWAAGIRLFGDAVPLWKAWFFPFALVFALSLERLFRRFAAGLEAPLLWLTVLSPTFLPSLNLMPDVPALALALASVSLFLAALDRASYALALAAGGVAALAMQTKYTAFTAPAVMVVAALLARPPRPGLALTAAAVAAAGFAGWEFFVYWMRGSSHFLFALGLGDALRRGAHSDLIIPLLTVIGGVASTVSLLGLVALGVRGRWVVAAGLAILYGDAVIAWWPFQQTILALAGGSVWAVAATVSWRLLRSRPDARGADAPDRRADWFLLAWLAIELASYFAISPFPAVRRLMAVIVVLTLLTGRLAARTAASGERRRLLRAVAAFGVMLGVGFAVLDWWEARVRQLAAADAMAVIRSHDPNPQAVWFTGHWGFQFYAERQCMKPLYAGGPPLHPGDWLVLTIGGHDSQMIWLPPGVFRRVQELRFDDPIRFSVTGIYLGNSPLKHRASAGERADDARPEPRVDVGIGRIEVDAVPDSLLPPELLVRWAATRNRPLPRASIPSVLVAIGRVPDVVASGRAAERGVTPADVNSWLRRLTSCEDADVRAAAARSLKRLEPATQGR